MSTGTKLWLRYAVRGLEVGVPVGLIAGAVAGLAITRLHRKHPELERCDRCGGKWAKP